jgi:nitrite reductase/ring-hydroxylating ferredoxin subunit
MSPEVPGEADFRRALERTWWPVARSLDLDRPYQAHLLDRKLAVFRGRDGNPRVTDNRCPHRGASLSHGEVVDNAIQCPYHGWQWDGYSGRCMHIPSLSDQAQIPSSACLKTYPSTERWGLVWTCLADDPARGIPDPDWLKNLDWIFDVRISDVAAHVLSVQENFRDVAHFAFVHKDTIPVRSAVVEPLQVERDGFEVKFALAVPYVAEQQRISRTETDTVMRYHAIAPHFASIMADDGLQGARYLLNCPCPVSMEHTRTFYVNGVTRNLAGELPELIASEERVYAEDREVVGEIEPRRLGQPFEQVHTTADAYTLAFRRAFIEYVKTYGTPTVDHDAGAERLGA